MTPDIWLLGGGIIIIAYFLGSIPSGYLAGYVSGVDVRSHGSGNIGATNVLRVLGKRWGYAVFFADAFKGFLAVRAAIFIARGTPAAVEYVESYAILAAATCVAGHSFPIWLRFKGGKGVATSAGALFGVVPIAVMSSLVSWLLVFYATRYVSLASIIAAIGLPLAVGALVALGMTQGSVLFYFSFLMAVLVVWRHRSNISRLVAGTEPRFARK